MPFGLTNAPATFQCYMNHIFRKYLGEFVIVFLDDILIYSKTPDQHVKHLDIVLSILKEHSFYAKLHKCNLCLSEIEYLGFIINKNGVKADPKKV